MLAAEPPEAFRRRHGVPDMGIRHMELVRAVEVASYRASEDEAPETPSYEGSQHLAAISGFQGVDDEPISRQHVASSGQKT